MSNLNNLIAPQNQVYTISPYPLWLNSEGRTGFAAVDTPQGDYRIYPFAAFHPLYTHGAFAFVGGKPWVSGPWVKADQRWYYYGEQWPGRT